MPTLTMPAPELVFDPPEGPPALEKPVTLRLGAVKYADARELSGDDVRTIGAFVYRGATGNEEVWDEKQQIWTAAPGDPAALALLTPIAFSPAQGEPSPWKGTLVAAGQKDKSGTPRFVKAESGTPTYRVRAYAVAVRDGVEHHGLGAPSPDLQFVSAADNSRFGVTFDTAKAADAGTARMALQNSARNLAGYLEIRAAGGQEVEVANCDASGAVLARVTLAANGDIRLEPAAGRSIVLNGPLEAQRVTYQPHGGGGRHTL
jgi:hypothetical protein